VKSGHVLVGSSNGDVALLNKADGKILDEKKRLLDDRISQMFFMRVKIGIRDASANAIDVSITNEKIQIYESSKINNMKSCKISEKNVDIGDTGVYPHLAHEHYLNSPHAVVPSSRSATVAIDFSFPSNCYYVVDQSADEADQHRVIKIGDGRDTNIQATMSEPIIQVALSGNRVFELTSTGRLLSFSKR